MFIFKKKIIFLLLIVIFLVKIPNEIFCKDFNNKLTYTKQEKNNLIKLKKIQNTLKSVQYKILNKNKYQLTKLNKNIIQLIKDTNKLDKFFFNKLQATINQLKILQFILNQKIYTKNKLKIIYKIYILENKKNMLNEKLKQITLVKKNALSFSKQINILQTEFIKNKITFNDKSLFNSKFWVSLIDLDKLEIIKIIDFFNKIKQLILLSWNSKNFIQSFFWLILSILIPTIIKKTIKNFLIYISTNKIHDINLCSSLFTIINSIMTIIVIIMTYYCIILSFLRYNYMFIDITNFINSFSNIIIFCSLFFGLSSSFISYDNPNWRLLNINDDIAKLFKNFPYIFTLLIFIFQSVEVFSYIIINDNNKIIFFNGLNALLISISFLFISKYINNLKFKNINYDNKLINYSKSTKLIKFFLMISSSIIILLLSIGYITLSRFISYKILLFCIMFCIFYFIKSLLNNYLNYLFNKKNIVSQKIKNFFSINECRFQQICVLIVAIIKTIIIIIMIILMFNNTFIYSISHNFLQKIIFLNNQKLLLINLISKNLIFSLLFLIFSLYLLKIISNWLKFEFFPKTNIENGIRISLLTLFNNISYVIITFITFSLLGLKWNKLAWIVSALSVGIGFGLQEIVKNFISGIILLTERPIKVGDLVSIDGIEGDIKNIKIRATEIQLEDKSILIVPNSQLISQKVRNITLDNNKGIIKIILTFPVDSNFIKIKEILLKIYNKNTNILKKPEPCMYFLDITTKGIILSITGQVYNYRHISCIKSELIFNILNTFRNEGIFFKT